MQSIEELFELVNESERNQDKKNALSWEQRDTLECEYRSLYWEHNEMQIVAHDPKIVNSNTCSKYYLAAKIDDLANRMAEIIDTLGYTPEA